MFKKKKKVEDLSNIKTFPTLTNNDRAILNELLAAFCKDVSFLLPFEDVHDSYALFGVSHTGAFPSSLTGSCCTGLSPAHTL